MKIVVADSDRKSCKFLSEFLQREGHTVFVAKDDKDAVRLVTAVKSEFIFLDADFSGGNSLEVLKQVYAMDPNMPVIIMGGEETLALVEEAALTGPIGFIQKGNSPEVLLEKVKSKLKEPKPVTEKIKIMVVDDEQSIRNMLALYLKKKNFEPVLAATGEEALVKVREENPRLVLLDYTMPGMNGLETLQKLMEINPSLGVIMVTGASENWIWKRARSLGAYDYLVKPVDLKYLDLVLLTKLTLM